MSERERLEDLLAKVLADPKGPDWPIDEEETVFFSPGLMADHLRRELAALPE